MLKKLVNICSFLFIIILFFCFTNEKVNANVSEQMIINNDTKSKDMYPYIDLIKDRERTIKIEDVIPFGKHHNLFKQSDEIIQKKGFFETANWIKFEIFNDSNERDWLLEFAFPLIHEIEVYTDDNGKIKQLYSTGADNSFFDRPIEHRHFVFDIEIEHNTAKTFYVLAVGSADFHPPITLWDKDEFVIKTSKEFILLGIFYGIIIVMIIYNLFLFFSLKLRSYLYYVITIIFTLLGKLSINGVAFQYIWPNYPKWNLYSVPIWVSLACIFILIFSRNFLDINRFIPSFNKIFYSLIVLNSITILTLPFSRYIALDFMITFSLITFFAILTTAIICLIRGARQARFYLLGWIIFLGGVSLILLERAVIIPYSLLTEYAGQAALTIEVVLLSFALADKINIIRREKNIAEEKYIESQNIALKNLQKTDKLKDEFLAVTSHELRTPLYGIIGIAESLHDGITGHISKDMKKQLSMIIKSGQRLTNLVDEILDFSKLKYESINLNLKPVHINSVIDLVLAISKPMLKDKPIQIENNIPSNLPTILADENRLQQIFHNLIDNAIKYTEKGKITLNVEQLNETITISIIDTGQGISDLQMDLIFQPFQQGKNSISRETAGVGIGLNIADDLIKLHNGTLHVHSEIGVGSTFSVTFPIHENITAKEQVAVTIAENKNEDQDDFVPIKKVDNKNRPKILIADDELINLQVLTNQLTLEGFDVYTTFHSEEVFHILKNQSIDLVILDIMMPGMSGYDVCKKLRDSYTLMDLPILMLTAKSQLQDKMLAFSAGANDYLVKPCDKQELLSRVKTLVKVKTLNEKLIQTNFHLEDKVLERTNDLKLANEELKMMAKSRREMLANIAHELGTPVTLMHNYIQSIAKGIIKSDDNRFQNLVNDKINTLNRLIEDLFDLSTLEAGTIRFNMNEINLHDWLTKIYERYELTTIQYDRKFSSDELDKGLKYYTCKIDGARMEQLFTNLINNAIKHTNEKNGTITFKSHLINNNNLLIEIKDNGSGIKQEDLPLVFDRFYKKNDSDDKGSGLGLAIVKQIILNHDGKITVDSELNIGTTFSIVLPIKSVS